MGGYKTKWLASFFSLFFIVSFTISDFSAADDKPILPDSAASRETIQLDVALEDKNESQISSPIQLGVDSDNITELSQENVAGIESESSNSKKQKSKTNRSKHKTKLKLNKTEDSTKTLPKPAAVPARKSLQPFCKRGIDVSRHNKEINWQAVKDSGIEFAILRTSYGWSDWEKQTDQQLKNNIAGAKAAGIPIGAYHYSYATNPQEALLEADFFIDRLRWTQWEYPVFIDLEDKCQKNLTNAQRTDIILTFLQRLQEAGYYTGFYTCLNWQRYMLDMNRLGGHELWIAHWHPTCGCTRPYGIWQHTSNGSVPGIDGRVDLDFCYVDYPSIIKNLHLNGF